MVNIEVRTSNEKIWEESRILAQVARHARHGAVCVDLRHEGPCCESSGINRMLQIVTSEHDIDPTNLIVKTSNQITSSRYHELRTGFEEVERSQYLARHHLPQHSATPQQRFGLFVGRSNWKRLAMAAYLWQHHGEHTVMTYHFDPEIEYHRANFELERCVLENWHDPDIFAFLQVLPLRFDQQHYPILWSGAAFDLDVHYNNFFCELVCETYFSGRTFFVTEKTWRCIINRRPFVVQGPQWYLENLRRLGFRTFDSWWSEGYDHDIDGGTLQSLRAVIDFIAAQPLATLHRWLAEMQPILEHNVQTLLRLTQQQILHTEYQQPS